MSILDWFRPKPEVEVPKEIPRIGVKGKEISFGSKPKKKRAEMRSARIRVKLSELESEGRSDSPEAEKLRKELKFLSAFTG
ncbi:MAG: hypothetical protein C4523_02500 [Myxococcales bacterium]|nr:MAG: hypothetical protein C4523_02500 [Myxococcales bacterium]